MREILNIWKDFKVLQSIPEFDKMVMPLVASYNSTDTYIIDYECSYVDVYLSSVENFVRVLLMLAPLEKRMKYIRPAIYVLISFILISIKKLRQNTNSRLFAIHAVSKCITALYTLIPTDLIFSKYFDVLFIYLEVSSFFWLALASYDYMKTIR